MIRNIVPKAHKLTAPAYTYAWDHKAARLLPDHYKKRCIEFMKREPEPIHYKPKTEKWRYDVTQHKVLPVQNVPIHVIYPKSVREGLYAGEGYIKGFVRRKKLSRRFARVWAPMTLTECLYSEILDKWMKINLSPRAMNKITELMGLDYYILETHERDLNSELGIQLKREMLMALGKPDELFPNDPKKKAYILRNYGKYTIPYEEAEWIGLPVDVALNKVYDLKEAEDNAEKRPLKEIFAEQLIEHLRTSCQNNVGK